MNNQALNFFSATLIFLHPGISSRRHGLLPLSHPFFGKPHQCLALGTLPESNASDRTIFSCSQKSSASRSCQTLSLLPASWLLPGCCRPEVHHGELQNNIGSISISEPCWSIWSSDPSMLPRPRRCSVLPSWRLVNQSRFHRVAAQCKLQVSSSYQAWFVQNLVAHAFPLLVLVLVGIHPLVLELVCVQQIFQLFSIHFQTSHGTFFQGLYIIPKPEFSY